VTTEEPGTSGPAVEQDLLSVTHTGDADACDGGLVVTGIRIGDDLTTAQVSSTGDAHAEGHGSIAVSGVLNQHHHPLPPTPYQVRTSLPADTAVFTGRREEAEAIITLVEQATGGGRGGVVTIQGGVQAIDGMPGIGKTALAVHVAHQVKCRFPDRQLFIDLHGHTSGAGPVEAFEALGGLLTATGMDARYLPATLKERVWHWRNRMAEQKALLVLDNARSSSQVTPLLPATPGCLVLVTSRRYLGDLDTGAQPITLDVLPPIEARKLFRRLAPRAGTDPDPAVDEVAAELADGLPLAITLLARVYVRHPNWTLTALVDKTRDRLLTVHAEDATIAAAFDLSYNTLSEPQQRLFTLMGVHPGTETDGYVAAALAQIPRADAEELLEDLYGARLLTELSPDHPGRYGMHDLVRTYVCDGAATTLTAADRDQVLDRLLDYYQATAARADTFLARYTRPAPTQEPPAPLPSWPTLLDDAQALDWARTERANLIACLDHATVTGRHHRVVALTAGMASLLRRDGPWAEAAFRHATAIEAARGLGDRLGQAHALTELGVVRYLTGEYRPAADLIGQALDLYRQLGDRLGQAHALTELGDVRFLTGEYGQAADLIGQGLDLYRQLGDRLGQAQAF
jgi:tetratricopeptide (TPR) repeat protein